MATLGGLMLECDADKERFEEKLGKIARAKLEAGHERLRLVLCGAHHGMR
jgi:hypothetical protein